MTHLRPPRTLAVWWTSFFIIGHLVLPSNGKAEDTRSIDFATEIRPILSDTCVRCHGPDASQRAADLRLDTAEGALADLGGYAAIVPGKPEESELYLRIAEEVADFRMPPADSGKSLSAEQIELIRQWIAQGAPWEEHWAFTPPKRPPVPPVQDSSWVRNSIDAFILAPLEQDGIAPSVEADRATLIRRASLDVIGLPPTPEEVEAFLADERPDAYEHLIDRLLSSPHFGERWGRRWLDNARYADSNGYSIDAPREIWLYRDWVIDALNRDLPFDEFTIDQLAGDLRPNASMAQLVATGFHRNTPINQEGGIDREQFRIESVIDRVNTTGSVWMGLTIGCAQCHDHKYDPISQLDYFQFFAFLNTVDEPTIPVASAEDVARRDEVNQAVNDYLAGIERDPDLLKRQHAWEIGLDGAGRQKQSQEVREAFDLPFDKRPAERNRVVFAAFIDQSDDPIVTPHRNAIASIKKDLPTIPTTMVVREQKDPRTTHFLMAGDFTRPGDPVQPDVPSVLPPLTSNSDARPNRLDLAHWLVDPQNPLTARVAVNRLWQAYFGRGIVETDEDFGTQGTVPSHPDLLDWLAVELIDRGWSLKTMHRLILTSATYRQSSQLRPDLVARDPTNRRLARQSRLRLDAELIRDSALVASGLLTETVGGPSVFPPQPDGVMSLGQMNRAWVADTGPNRFRRGLYTFFWRATPHPLLVGFDAPDATFACTRRTRSNTPLQALMLLNDQAFYEFAQALADRVLAEGPPDDAGKLDLVFRLCLARSPDPIELDRLMSFLDAQRRLQSGSEGEDSAESRHPDRAAWTAIARVLLNLDEFITRE
ncbi:PSD1 and planctomycete cytochrome C domain-containing protein [Tautonia marina]|uniref:PSD1 and planctomycete cytochrome C domain-containing protein n=1 Tax=Tautonia marina TaxID=2653855 RepID=UPI0012608C40|nr:PSD1 and planctomycete cytochrome C domain-containing protein [Tautonia marina]